MIHDRTRYARMTFFTHRKHSRCLTDSRVIVYAPLNLLGRCRPSKLMITATPAHDVYQEPDT